MKRYTIILLLIALPVLLKAQAITGKVMRMGGGAVIANASVYFSGSVKGTSTDSLGAFKIYTEKTNVPIIISCIGYYSATVSDYAAGTPLTVYLKPKENIMREVQIGFDGMAREEKLRIFKREFLGTSDYAHSCTIVNISDIDLTYDKAEGKLTAFCNNPIIIKNKMLGYTLTYYLDNFSHTSNHVSYAGNYMFKEDATLNPKELKKIKKNREDVYSDSRMHFIRALWSRNLDVSGFAIFNNLYQKITDQDILFANKDNNKFIILSTSIRITYKGDYHYLTYLTQHEKYSFIDQSGYSGTGLTWSGPMSAQRIGDMLPFEYVSLQDPVTKNIATSKP
jgi:hypothetical protein